MPKLYAVQARKPSGEWHTFAEYADPVEAERIAARLAYFGADVRIEVVTAIQ